MRQQPAIRTKRTTRHGGILIKGEVWIYGNETTTGHKKKNNNNRHGGILIKGEV